MKVPVHIFVSSSIAIISVAGAFSILTQLSPDENSFWVLVSLYVGVFLAMFGTASVLGVGVRMVVFRTSPRHEYLRPANRQAVLFGVMTVAILIMEAGKVFNLWSAALVFIIFILMELYIQ